MHTEKLAPFRKGKATGLRCEQTVAHLYRCGWQVELLFQRIKQQLGVKAFFDASANAVKTQIWTAISAYGSSPSSNSGSAARLGRFPL